MTITMTELARRLKLSQSTVSLVLNNRDKNRVRPELAEKIREAAREVGFRPNRAAGELRRRKSHAVGILLPSTRNFYYAEIVADLHRAVRLRGYAPLFAFWESADEQPEAADSLLAWNPDGLITVEPGLIPDNVHLPAVSFYKEDLRFDCLNLDLEAAIRLQLDHLRSLGHTSVAWLGNSDDPRFGILTQAAPQSGFRFEPRWQVLQDGVIDFSDGKVLLRRFLDQAGSELPTAILAHNDMAALGVIRGLHESGYRVPEDFSVVGHDSIIQAAYAIPALTTVQYRARQSIGEQLVELLFKRMEHPEAPHVSRRITPQLIIGESTGGSRRA